MKKIIESGICNYYGEVVLNEHEGKYYLSLENYDGDSYYEVSKEFADMFIKEFEVEKPCLIIDYDNREEYLHKKNSPSLRCYVTEQLKERILKWLKFCGKRMK